MQSEPDDPSRHRSRYRTSSRPIHVLVASDKFAGTLTAEQACRAMARAVRQTCPDATVFEVPLADGGEGTLDVLARAWHATVRSASVGDALGRPITARYGVRSDGTYIFEMAQASGLRTLERHDLDPLRATSRGTGELMRIGLKESTAGVVVGVGGSASSDGGTGAARIFGWRFLDASGNDLPDGGAALVDLERIVPPEGKEPGAPIVGAVDVGIPLTGAQGAARIFAPQKGATTEDVDLLEQGLVRLARCIRRDVGVDVEGLPGAGAGGGFGAGLVAFFGARLRPGFDLVADAVGLDRLLARSDLVITGEGRLDEGSLHGKGPVALAARARKAGVPCVAIVGSLFLPEAQLRALGFLSVTESKGAAGGADAAVADATSVAIRRFCE